MAKHHFPLKTKLEAPLRQGPEPSRVSLSLTGFRPVVRAGESVVEGQLVARSARPGQGDLHAPICGKVQELHGLTQFELRIEAEGEGRVEPTDLSALSGNELCCTLAGLGVNTKSMSRARTLIINAMPPEPGILVSDQLLREYRADVALGLETVKRIVSPAQVVLAGIDVDASALGSCAVKHLPAAYPAGLDPLVTKAVTGNENPEGSCILSVLDLYLIGRVAETGLPVTRTVLTLNGVNVAARIGTPVGDLFAQAGLTPKERDRVVLGGPLRGEAITSLEEGIAKDSMSLSLIPAAAFPPVADTACINCGECVLHCPSRVLPNLISRAAEFRFWDRAEGYGALQCMECGLCGYFCPGRRPLLQYIRLAKHELELLSQGDSLLEPIDAPKCC